MQTALEYEDVLNAGGGSPSPEVIDMSISINISKDLYQQALALAEAHQVLVEEIFVSAFAEQLASWQRLRGHAARGDREKYFAVLENVPDVEPAPSDRI